MSPVRGGIFIARVLIPLFLQLRRSGMALRMTGDAPDLLCRSYGAGSGFLGECAINMPLLTELGSQFGSAPVASLGSYLPITHFDEMRILSDVTVI